MSKSRGTFITARQYLDEHDPELLRFYYASNLTRSMSDFDMEENDFRNKINHELVGNIANFIYRVLSFANNNLDSKLSKVHEDSKIIEQYNQRSEAVREHYHMHNYRGALREILEISALGNRYFQEHEPWQLIKTDKKRCREIVTFAANIVKNLSVMLAPILPRFSKRIQKQLGLDNLTFKELNFNLQQHRINKARIVFVRIEGKALPIEPKEFALNLKVAEIISVEEHPDADKLYVIRVNLGKEERRLVAGLRSHYKKEELSGKKIVVVANLKPAKLRGIESQGMLLAAQDGEKVKVIEAPESMPGDDVSTGVKSSEKQISFDEFRRVKMTTRNGRVIFEGAPLKTSKEDVIVDICDNAKVR